MEGHLDDTVSITPEDTCWAEHPMGPMGVKAAYWPLQYGYFPGILVS